MTIPITQVENSVTGVGSDDDRTVESFRAENDCLRDAINIIEKRNLDTEARIKSLTDEVHDLKQKIKLLMERKDDNGADLNIGDIVSSDEIKTYRGLLKTGDRHRNRTADSVHEDADKVVKNLQAQTDKPGSQRPNKQTKSTPTDSKKAVAFKTPASQKNSRASKNEAKPSASTAPIVEVDEGQQVRDSLRCAKTSEDVLQVIDKAKMLGLKHEQHLGEKLLVSMIQP